MQVNMADFNDFIGKEQIKDHLKTAIEQGKVSHAYIIAGEKYSGKKFVSRVFAKALLCECEDPKMRPCCKCHSCSQADTDNNPDLIVVTHAKPNVISVDDVREQVNNDIVIKPYGGRRKVYIIPEAEKMNQQAQNAILKTFEEPPEYAVILLLTTNAEELLATIRSRAVLLNMKPVPDDRIRKFLYDRLQVPDYKADMCVAFARGNLGKAELLARNDKFDAIRGDVLTVLRNVRKMDVSDLSACVKKAAEYKTSIDDYLDIILVWYRDVLMYKATSDENNLIFKDEIQYIRKVADSISYQGIQEIVDMLDVSAKRISANVNFELTMELLFLKLQETV